MPGLIVGRNSPLRRWSTGAAGVDTAFIDQGSPWQNGFAESVSTQFRREQLTGEIVDTMVEAKYLAGE